MSEAEVNASVPDAYPHAIGDLVTVREGITVPYRIMLIEADRITLKRELSDGSLTWAVVAAPSSVRSFDASDALIYVEQCEQNAQHSEQAAQEARACVEQCAERYAVLL
jgi:hypothetical protein